MNENKLHLFLTGERQVGKSTIIRRFLNRFPLTPQELGGFVSGIQILEDGGSSVHLITPGGSDSLDETNCIMTRDLDAFEKRKFPEIYPQVFDSRGVELLQNTEGKRLILMDELGFAERNALQFRQTVLETLDGEIPVLGVLKKKPNEFLDQVAQHPKVTVISVTEENREEIADLMMFGWKILKDR